MFVALVLFAALDHRVGRLLPRASDKRQVFGQVECLASSIGTEAPAR